MLEQSRKSSCSGKILIVSRNRPYAHSLTALLESAGYGVENAQSEERVSELSADHTFDAAVVDMNGVGNEDYLILKTIGASNPGVPAIALIPRTALKARGPLSPEIVCIVKPVTSSTILEEVSRALKSQPADRRHFREEAFRSQPMPLLIVDQNLFVLDANDAAGQLLGVRQEELLGEKIISFLDGELPAILPESNISVESTVRRPDDSTSPVRVIFSPLPLANDANAFCVGLHDSTQEKIREDELCREVEGLNARISKLRADRERLREADKAKTQLLSNASHELRSAVGAIISYVDLLLDENRSTPAEEAHASLTRIHKRANQVRSLLKSVLDLVQADGGHIGVESELLDAEEIIETAAASVYGEAMQKKLSLAIEVETQVQYFASDPRLLKQILVNLLSNAVAFTPAGGAVKVEIKKGDRAGEVLLSVSDTGIGIPPEALDRIFDPFYRATRASNEIGTGAGIGLALVKRYTELLGGSVSVESTLGSGSTFTVRFPQIEHPAISAS